MFLALLSLAAAEDPTTPPAEPVAEPASPPIAASEIGPPTRPFLMEVNFRGRYLSLPSSIMDIWFYRHGDDGLPARPKVAGYSLGLEWVIKNEQANGIFYVEYLGSAIKDGYWDDVESPDDFTDGTYVKTENFGLVVLGADYAFELHATPWLSFLFGGGLGLGIRTGDIIVWDAGEVEGTIDADNLDPDCLPNSPAYDRADTCGNDGPLNLPKALPVIDVNIGARFNINDSASIRLEGGLHNLLYAGGAVGIVF